MERRYKIIERTTKTGVAGRDVVRPFVSRLLVSMLPLDEAADTPTSWITRTQGSPHRGTS
jgi:hypothetical protein